MKTVYARDYGILPNQDDKEISGKLRKMLEENKTDTTFILDNGRYDFWDNDGKSMELYLSNTDDINPRKLALLFDNVENIIFDGSNSEFVCHGQLLPITALDSKNVTFKNFSIDWEIPLSAEMTVKNVGDGFADIFIDKKLYPFKVENEQIIFCGENWESSANWIIEFDVNTKKAVFNTADSFVYKKAELLNDGLVRCYGKFNPPPTVGNYGVVRHNKRINSAMFMENSIDMRLDNITVHNCGGLGILAQFCTDLSFHRVNFRPNTLRGRRVLSGHDDGLHLSNNRGHINVDECYFYGLMDDPINVHGTSVQAVKFIDNHSIACHFGNSQSNNFAKWAKCGDIIAVLDNETLNPICELTVSECTLKSENDFVISVNEEISLALKDNLKDNLKDDCMYLYALENISATPSLTCKNNFFGSCRARGVLVTTPKPVLIENNHFQSTGSAILIAGDGVYWYESGACHDVTIRNNVFDSCCNICGYQFCEGVISIMPEVPKPNSEKPFHRNIKICNNLFVSRNTTLLYAFSVENLSFCNNTIERTYEYGKASHEKDELFRFIFCKDVTVEKNILLGEISEP